MGGAAFLFEEGGPAWTPLPAETQSGQLVQVLCGAVYDVAVDLRQGAETFRQWEGFYLTAENKRMVYIPKGWLIGSLSGK